MCNERQKQASILRVWPIRSCRVVGSRQTARSACHSRDGKPSGRSRHASIWSPPDRPHDSRPTCLAGHDLNKNKNLWNRESFAQISNSNSLTTYAGATDRISGYAIGDLIVAQVTLAIDIAVQVIPVGDHVRVVTVRPARLLLEKLLRGKHGRCVLGPRHGPAHFVIWYVCTLF